MPTGWIMLMIHGTMPAAEARITARGPLCLAATLFKSIMPCKATAAIAQTPPASIHPT